MLTLQNYPSMLTFRSQFWLFWLVQDVRVSDTSHVWWNFKFPTQIFIRGSRRNSDRHRQRLLVELRV